jgi:hypothetical protein
VNRPSRQAGNGFAKEISTKGAAQQRVSRLQRSSNPLTLSWPDEAVQRLIFSKNAY